MRVRGISGSRDGDTGVYSRDDGSESPQFTWDQFGSTWFTSLSDVEILGTKDGTTDDSEDSEDDDDEPEGSERDDSEPSTEEEDEDAEVDEDTEDEDAADSRGDASSALPVNKWLCGACKKWKVDTESGLGEVTCNNGPSVFHSEQSVTPGQPGVISWKMKVDGNSSFSIGAIPQSEFSQARQWMHDNTSSALVVNNKSTGGGNKRRCNMVSRSLVLLFCELTIGGDRLGPKWCAVWMEWLASSLLQSKGRIQLCWLFPRNLAVLFIWRVTDLAQPSLYSWNMKALSN
jgi:hypothetical protein